MINLYFGAIAASLLIASLMTNTALSADSFDTYFVELDTSKMVSTGDGNYAISNMNLPSNWRTVSVNGDEMTISLKDKQVQVKKLSQLSAPEKSSLENIRMSLVTVIRLGPMNAKSETGNAKLTTFDRNGGTSSMSAGGGSSSSSSSSTSSSSSGAGSESSVSKTGPNAYIVAKSDFPFNWKRLFINDDLVTVVYKDGRVIMLPEDLLKPEEKTKAAEVRKEVEKSTKVSDKIAGSFMSSLSHPMDFVNKAFNGLFG